MLIFLLIMTETHSVIKDNKQYIILGSFDLFDNVHFFLQSVQIIWGAFVQLGSDILK